MSKLTAKDFFKELDKHNGDVIATIKDGFDVDSLDEGELKELLNHYVETEEKIESVKKSILERRKKKNFRYYDISLF